MARVVQPKHCAACGYMPVKFRAVICSCCARHAAGVQGHKTPAVRAEACVAVSGGLPSLGKPR